MRNHNTVPRLLALSVAVLLGATACGGQTSAESQDNTAPKDEVVMIDKTGHEVHYLKSGERITFPVYANTQPIEGPKALNESGRYSPRSYALSAVVEFCLHGQLMASTANRESKAGGGFALIQANAPVCIDNVLTLNDFAGLGETPAPIAPAKQKPA